MSIRSIPLEAPPRRVVSLVPSLTESFFDLGFGEHVVGITDYCIHPAQALEGIQRVGGPKNPNIDQIMSLQPDLVAANQEENSQAAIEQLTRLGIPVWLTFPVCVEDVFGDLWNLARLFRSERAMNQVRGLEKALEYQQMASLDRPRRRVFCPIWQEKSQNEPVWWMTFNQETYSHDLLMKLGAENIFKDRKRLYPLAADLGTRQPDDPGTRDTRYPRVQLAEIVQADPELVILPDEPYEFGEGEGQWLKSTLEKALSHPVEVVLVDGSLITWPGTRLGKALAGLSELFS